MWGIWPAPIKHYKVNIYDKSVAHSNFYVVRQRQLVSPVFLSDHCERREKTALRLTSRLVWIPRIRNFRRAPSAIATGSAQALLIYHHLAWNPGKNIWNIDELHGNFVLDCTEKKRQKITIPSPLSNFSVPVVVGPRTRAPSFPPEYLCSSLQASLLKI